MYDNLPSKEKIKGMEELKLTKPDYCGLNKLDRGGQIISQLTEYDSFLFQDVLQLANTEQLQEFKSIPGLAAKFDPEQNLYIITARDLDPLYYNYATMYNRFKNTVYAGKVYKSSELFRQFVSGVVSKVDEKIKSSMGSYNMTQIEEREEERSRN